MSFLANPLLNAMMVSAEDTQPESGTTVDPPPEVIIWLGVNIDPPHVSSDAPSLSSKLSNLCL